MILKHSWNKLSYEISECGRCNCQKILQPSRIGTRLYPLYYYYRNGEQLKTLPMCKSIIHCDK